MCIRDSISSEPKPKLSELDEFRVQWAGSDDTPDLASVHSMLSEIATRAVVSRTLDRLSDDPALNAWVREGFQLQIVRGQSVTCPYCEAQLEPGFLDQLAQHFSDDYEALVRDIRASIGALKGLTADSVSPDIDLYPELTKKFKQHADVQAQQTADLAGWIEACTERLEARLENPTRPVEAPPGPPATFEDRYNDTILQLNRLIDTHNTRVENHAAEAAEKKGLLEGHIIAEAMRVEGYAKMN